MIWNIFARPKAEKIPSEEELPHTYTCECDVKWVAKGLEPQPCWACGNPVTPICFHI